jgi:hypothetical protein
MEQPDERAGRFPDGEKLRILRCDLARPGGHSFQTSACRSRQGPGVKKDRRGAPILEGRPKKAAWRLARRRAGASLRHPACGYRYIALIAPQLFSSTGTEHW